MIKIAQASISENGTINGKKGDQTGKELNIKELKSNTFTRLIRAVNKQVANNMSWVAITGACNKHIGYSQADRNSLWKEAQKTEALANIETNCNCDCSSFATVVCEVAYNAVYGTWLPSLDIKANCLTTANIEAKLLSTGQFNSLPITKLTDIKLGDILVKKGHCAIVVEV